MSITKNAVFDRVRAAITTAYPTAYCTSERIPVPDDFPCAWIIEIDTYPEYSALSLDFTDDQRRSDFEIQAFSNDRTDATGQAEDIINIAKATMKAMGYRCTTSRPLENGADVDIKRHIARFTRYIGSGDTLPNT